MALQYRCLILDHDETGVDSTPVIHYPAYLEIMRLLRPETTPVSLEGWFRKIFEPGISHYYKDELRLTKEELKKELEIWRQYTTTMMPRFYDGFIEALEDFRAQGGLVTVVSQSEKDIIERHYGGNGNGFRPDVILGWSDDKDKRKPHPWPVHEIVGILGITPDEVLVVDDSKPGIEMALAAGVDAAAAAWAYRKYGLKIPEIESYMREKCVAYFDTTDQFRSFVLIEAEEKSERKNDIRKEKEARYKHG